MPARVANPARLDRIRTALGDLATPTGREPLRDLLVLTTSRLVVEQGRRGIDPVGDPLTPLKHSRRRPLQGRGRIWDAATVDARGERIIIDFPHFPPEILRAHQDGAVIPPRRVAASERLAAPKSGRFLSGSRAKRRKLVYVVPIRAHTARGWILPRRPVVPAGGMPERYAEALNAAAAAYVREVTR